MAASSDSKDVPFEKALERLESIVGKLESGEVGLEKAIGLYEEGRRLGARCSAQLEALEKRVQLVREGADGQLAAEDFGASEDD